MVIVSATTCLFINDSLLTLKSLHFLWLFEIFNHNLEVLLSLFMNLTSLAGLNMSLFSFERR